MRFIKKRREKKESERKLKEKLRGKSREIAMHEGQLEATEEELGRLVSRPASQKEINDQVQSIKNLKNKIKELEQG